LFGKREEGKKEERLSEAGTGDKLSRRLGRMNPIKHVQEEGDILKGGDLG